MNPGLLAQFALFGSQGAAFRMSEDLAKGSSTASAP
jgi:hypothetical protein